MFGLETALILRPANDNKFQVVGEAYYHSVMKGEALLGPLPDGIEQVIRRSPIIGSQHIAYFDRDKNTVTRLDPRLGDLPPGWGLESDPEDVVLYSWFVNKETERKRTKIQDLLLSF